jgi:hypothetical protein
MPETKQIPLTPEQNGMIDIHQRLVRKAESSVAREQQRWDHAREMFEARTEVLQARKEALNAEQNHFDLFQAHLIQSLQLPVTAGDRGWGIVALPEGGYALSGEVETQAPDSDTNKQEEAPCSPSEEPATSTSTSPTSTTAP